MKYVHRQNLKNPVVCYPSSKNQQNKAKPLQRAHSVMKYCGGGAGGREKEILSKTCSYLAWK